MQIDSKKNGSTEADEDEDSEDALLRKMMGFPAFKTTQNNKIPGNDEFGIRKEKSTHYRQYMNCTGGFNRPLSPSRDCGCTTSGDSQLLLCTQVFSS
jgi:U4/U6.U5 small nuclear ribonucleoproteins